MKEVVLSNEAREGLKRGVNLICDPVKATLGPRGRNVLYGFHYGYPVSTKDGVTVSRQIEAKDGLEQLAVLAIRQAAVQTADDAGDGTTTACVLAQEIFSKGLKSLNTGANPVLIKRGIDDAVKEVINFISNQSQPIEGDEAILNVATLSANNDRFIGRLVLEAIKEVGIDGVISLEDNQNKPECEVITVEGMQLSEGMVSPFFMTDTVKVRAEYNNPKILLIDGELADIMPIKPLIEEVIGKQKLPLLIICHNLIENALQIAVQNRAQGGLPLLICKAPQHGEYRKDMMTDIGIVTGAGIIGGTIGISAQDFTFDMLGECERVEADRFSTTIIKGKGKQKDIEGRISLLDQLILECRSDYEKEKLQERLAKLTTGVAIIRVGAKTEIEQKEMKMRVEDSLCATKAAVDDGIVPGGGTCLLKASYHLEEKLKEKMKDTP